jgi:hypothetical protein
VELEGLSLSPLLAFTNGFTGCKLVGEVDVSVIAAGVLLGRDEEDGRGVGAGEVPEEVDGVEACITPLLLCFVWPFLSGIEGTSVLLLCLGPTPGPET